MHFYSQVRKIIWGISLLACSSAFSENGKWDDKPLQESFRQVSEQPGAVTFKPPQGWFLADTKSLPSHVQIMVVGKGAYEFPPSINLAFDEFNGTLKEYLKVVDGINKRMGGKAQDLGVIHTEAGEARLLQIDSKNVWGPERQMQAIIVKNGKAYILTASAHKNEFSNFYPQFFSALKSLKINPD